MIVKKFREKYQFIINFFIYIILKIHLDIVYIIFLINRYLINFISTH